MSNHPNRGHGPSKNPTVAEIKAAREVAGLSQAASAALVYRSTRNWEQWEQGGDNARRMCPAIFELYLIKTGQMKVKKHV
jgi:DNA-binding transcriptional regulator YiaG